MATNKSHKKSLNNNPQETAHHRLFFIAFFNPKAFVANTHSHCVFNLNLPKI